MISSIVIGGVLKLVQIIRYGKTSSRPDVVRIYDPRATVPEKVLTVSKYNNKLFVDDETGQQFKERNGILTLAATT